MVSKRADLQSIRGIAIGAVLAFHFYPNYFPNGFLGVDQFFVLSGYLMCMILKKSKNLNMFQIICNFYIRRFRRILPLYYLIIFISFIALYSLFSVTSVEINKKSAKNAMLFISNQVKSVEDDYFEKVTSSMDIFTHTWSLSVEIQFYLLAPFIFLMSRSKISIFTGCSIISFIYFQYFLPANIAFLNVISRIWQFMVGMIVYIIWQKKKKNEHYQILESVEQQKSKKNYETETWILTISAIFAVFFPISIDAIFMRPIVTILTGLLILLSNGNNIILSNKILNYIGDISYSLYLIHWPIYSFWKTTQQHNQLLLFFLLIVSIGFAILIHQLFEKWYIQLSNIKVFILIFIIFAANIAIQNYNQYPESESIQLYTGKTNVSLNEVDQYPESENVQFYTGKTNVSLDEVENQNRNWDIRDIADLSYPTCHRISNWCNHTGLNSTNQYSIIMMGNSWSLNQGGILYEECKHKFNFFMQGDHSSCEPLYPTKEYYCSQETIEDFQKHAEDFKPDYLFHVTRHISYGENYNGSLENDEVYAKMKLELERLLKNVKKKIYFLNAIPSPRTDEIPKIVGYLRNNVSFVEIDNKLLNMTNYEGARKRYAQLIKDCGEKCELIDYHNSLYRNDTNTYRFFDNNGYDYFTTGLHLTKLGKELIRPVWKKVCDSL